MTEIDRAISQIGEIHEHLARTEVCREIRAVPVAVAGVLGLLAAALQPRLQAQGTEIGFVLYWAAVAGICLAVGSAGILLNYLRQSSDWARRQTRIVVGQFLPSFVAGVLVTLAVTKSESLSVSLLPGLWACLFSLGIFAARPYLPRIIGWVGLYYLLAGAVLLATAAPGASPSPWEIGLTFGFGQLVSAVVLYYDLERNRIVP